MYFRSFRVTLENFSKFSVIEIVSSRLTSSEYLTLHAEHLFNMSFILLRDGSDNNAAFYMYMDMLQGMKQINECKIIRFCKTCKCEQQSVSIKAQFRLLLVNVHPN